MNICCRDVVELKGLVLYILSKIISLENELKNSTFVIWNGMKNCCIFVQGDPMKQSLASKKQFGFDNMGLETHIFRAIAISINKFCFASPCIYLALKHCSYHLIKRFPKGFSHLLVVSERFIWQICVCKLQTSKINLETFWVTLFTYCFNSSQRVLSLNILIAFHRFNVPFYDSFASDIKKMYYS